MSKSAIMGGMFSDIIKPQCDIQNWWKLTYNTFLPVCSIYGCYKWQEIKFITHPDFCQILAVITSLQFDTVHLILKWTVCDWKY